MYWLNPKFWFRKPHPLIVKNQEFFSEFNQSKLLTDYSFVVLDTELTGLNRRKDEIVSLGAVKIDNLQIDLNQTFYKIVQPKNIASNRSTLVHQITPTQMKAAQPLEEVLVDFVDFVGNSMLVGHHLELDMSFINRATWRHLGGTLSNPGMDTMRMSRRYNQTQHGYFKDPSSTRTSYRLEDLAKQYNLPLFTAHNAFGDAMQTACLFLWLIKKLGGSKGLSTLKSLYKAGHST